MPTTSLLQYTIIFAIFENFFHTFVIAVLKFDHYTTC